MPASASQAWELPRSLVGSGQSFQRRHDAIRVDLDPSLSALLAAALLWATLYVADSRRARDFALYGLLWGVSLLTNPGLGALLPFLLAGWPTVNSAAEAFG